MVRYYNISKNLTIFFILKFFHYICIMDGLINYIDEYYPNIKQEYIRKITPFYYEYGVNYRWIGEKSIYKLINGTYLRNGDIILHLKNINDDIDRFNTSSIKLSEAYKFIERVDDEFIIKGSKIPNTKKFIYMNVDGRDYNINQEYYRDYNNGVLNGRVIITCEQDKANNKKCYNIDPYYELYSVIGKSEWNLKHMYLYDGRENYDTMFNISVKEFKSYVFGRYDIKFKCDLFGD